MVPPDLTKRKSGVAAGQARVEEFKRKEREARARRPRGAFTAAQRAGQRVDGVGGDGDAHHTQAKLKADEEARKAAEAQARVASGENGDNGEDKKEESSSDDEEPEARRRLERRGRGLGRADAAQRWRDLEAKADALCQRAARHAPSVTRSRNRLELAGVAAMASTRCHAASAPST